MEQQYLTVKQFAERAGVSTQRVYQLLTKSLQEFTKTEHGKKYISIEGLRVFEKDPLQDLAKDLQSNLQEVASPETEILRETVEVLSLTKYLFTDAAETDCNDCTDYVLPLRPGDRVHVIEETSRGYFVKHEGLSGWYYGRLA